MTDDEIVKCEEEIPCNPTSITDNNIDDTTPPENVHENDVYWKFLDELEGAFRAFLSEARAGDLNKSAALRARKQSVVLRQNLKEYREVSVAHDRTHGRKTKAEKEASSEIDSL